MLTSYKYRAPHHPLELEAVLDAATGIEMVNNTAGTPGAILTIWAARGEEPWKSDEKGKKGFEDWPTPVRDGGKAVCGGWWLPPLLTLLRRGFGTGSIA